MNSLIFENAGEIDPRLITTFGVNVKTSDNPIGFFGTGLKYAIAILLRTKHELTIMSGARRFDFGLQTQNIRGKDFEIVVMSKDGGEPRPLGFTSDVGKNWEVWMAYRELRCNCQDEGGTIREAAGEPTPEADRTIVVVKGEELLRAHSLAGAYFLAGEPTNRLKNCEVHARESSGIFYRNVLVTKIPNGQMAVMTYNITADTKLTEDRTAANPYDLTRQIATSYLASDDADILRRVLCAPKGTFEHGLDYDWFGQAPGETFMEVVADLVRDRALSINQSARNVYSKHAKRDLRPDTITLTAVEQMMLERARAFCGSIGFNISYEVLVVESLGSGFLGLAENGHIYLAHRVFMQGTKAVASTLIEEFIHLKHGLADMTRELQTYLFDRIVSLGEELSGEPL